MALNNKTKDKYRRVIRGMMIVLAVVLLVMGLAVPIVNNAVAMGVAGELKALSMPAETTVIESTSLAGRFADTASSVQYFGALLLKSNCEQEELQTHFMQYNNGLDVTYRIARQRGQDITVLGDVDLAFREEVGEDGYYILYTVRNGGNALQWWLDMDVRG
ncbi:MAG: hypothetical protein IJO75_01120 [Clostridia bacterium]|nr:hypothetical protein [Clostridia bacterium]